MLRLFIFCLMTSFVTSKILPEEIRQEEEPMTFLSEEIVGSSFSFLIIGDFGGFPEPFYSTQLQRDVAATMAVQSRDNDCRFVVNLGDNFYFLGVKDVYDRRWKGTFEDVYSDPALYIPWYPTTGNHDWHGSVKAQIDYSKVSTRWVFPWYWYTVERILRPSGVKIRIIMFETTIPCGIGGKPDGVAIDQAMAEEEWAWLEKELKDGMDADYLIVAGHYPVYSAGNAGPIIPCLYNRLDPLLQQYNVSAYIAGHDHDAQHLTAPGSNVQHLIIGCGNFITPWFANENSDYFKPEFLFASPRNMLTGCFARGDVTTNEMKITFIEGKEGTEIHELSLARRDKTIL